MGFYDCAFGKKKNYKLYKIGNKTEQKTRPYGYEVEYRNMSIGDLVKLPNLLITAIDNKYYHYLPYIKNATIVIHDPTELKGKVITSIIQLNKSQILITTLKGGIFKFDGTNLILWELEDDVFYYISEIVLGSRNKNTGFIIC